MADDNTEFCNMVTDFLRREPGYEVLAAVHDGNAAVRACKELLPDLLLLDVVMPELDGIGVLEALQEEPERPKVLVLTAFGQEMMIRRALAAGADYYVMKPFDLRTLSKRIRQILSGQTNLWFEQRRQAIERAVDHYIARLGVPPHYKGCMYLRDAILLVVEDNELLSRVTKGLYPAVAELHKTTPDKVERAIRHAIETTWTRGDLEAIHEYFAYTVDSRKGKPSNSSFIARLADQIRLELRAG